MGISIAAVPNWEWLGNHLEWLRAADLLICPTQHTYRYVCDWRLQVRLWLGRRATCPGRSTPTASRSGSALAVTALSSSTAWAAIAGTRLDGSVTLLKRKGIEMMVEAMRASPRLNFVLYSLDPKHPQLPPNVEHRPAPADNRALYEHGDVCVQPSHLEGLGLQLLECQAAGMPLDHHRCPAHERA